MKYQLLVYRFLLISILLPASLGKAYTYENVIGLTAQCLNNAPTNWPDTEVIIEQEFVPGSKSVGIRFHCTMGDPTVSTNAGFSTSFMITLDGVPNIDERIPKKTDWKKFTDITKIKFQCEKPIKQGSIINFNEKTVAEQIYIDGTDFYINYTSLYNNKIEKNTGVKIAAPYLSNPFLTDFNFFELKTTDGASSTAQVVNGQLVSNALPVSDSAKMLQHGWDGSSGNISNNIFISKLGYSVRLAQLAGPNTSPVPGAPSSCEIYNAAMQIFRDSHDGRSTPLRIKLLMRTLRANGLFEEIGRTNSSITSNADEQDYIESLASACSSNLPGQSYVGTDTYSGYYNNYEESFTKTLYNPQVWGLNGWNVSIHHYLDRQDNTLYRGDGVIDSYTSVRTYSEGGNTYYFVPDKQNSEVFFVFDSTGKHIYTRSLMFPEKPLYEFTYNQDYKLNSIKNFYGKTTQFIYNAQNTIQKIVAPYGQETQFVVDNNQLVSVENSLLKKTEMSYDSSDLLVSFKNINGVVTNFEYAANGDFIQELKNVGILQRISNIIQNSTATVLVTVGWGNSLKQIQEYLREAKKVTTYNANNEATSEVLYSENGTTEFKTLNKNITHFSSNHPLWADDIQETAKLRIKNKSNSGYEQNFDNDYLRELNIAYSNGGMPYYVSYNKYQRLSAEYNYKYIENFNRNNRTLIYTSEGTSRVVLHFDENYNIIKIEENRKKPIFIEYNSNSQVVKKTQGSFYENYSYDTYGFLSSITNSLGLTTSFVNDIQGKVLTKTLPNNDQILFEYTDAGELKKITTPSNQVHNFQFSLGDYLSSYLNSDNKSTLYTYDTSKRLIQILKPNNEYLNYIYENNSNRLVRVETSKGNYSVNQYDLASRPLSLSSADGITQQLNYLGDEVEKEVWLDSDGSEIGSIAYNFKSGAPLIDKISINNSELATLDYNGSMRLVRLGREFYRYTQSNNVTTGVETTFIGTEFIRQMNTTLTNTGDGQHITNMETYYNGQLHTTQLGRIFDDRGLAREYTQHTEFTPPVTYNNYTVQIPEYDANDRVTKVSRSSKSYINQNLVSNLDFINHYSYPAGSNNNMKEFSQSLTEGGNTVKRTVANHSPDDRLLSLRGSVHRDYTYDDDGNLKTMTNCYGTTHYEYDVFSNLKKVTLPDGKIIEYAVDARNRRIKKSVNGQVVEYYLWYDQIHLAAVLNADKTPRLQYLYNLEQNNSPTMMIKDGQLYKIITDPAIGSVRYVYGDFGRERAQEIDYDEYGNILNNTNAEFQPVLYAGGLYDFDTKLYRFGARDYDPTVGRWTTKDPIGFAGGDTNLYAYVGGNPMSYNDPTGLARCSFSLSTGRLSCQSNDGNRQYATNAFSGGGSGAPIMAGSYNIGVANGRGAGFFHLSRGPFLDKLYQAQTFMNKNYGTPTGMVRGGFMLHQGQRSLGCITVDKNNQNDMRNYQNIQDLIQSEIGDSVLEVTQ